LLAAEVDEGCDALYPHQDDVPDAVHTAGDGEAPLSGALARRDEGGVSPPLRARG
jgi:hypothetical protein